MPQMMPMVWVIFPVIVMVISLIVMMMNEGNNLEAELEVLIGLEMENLEW